jgi:hypothetical protein
MLSWAGPKLKGPRVTCPALPAAYPSLGEVLACDLSENHV